MWYFFIENDKINGCGQCPCITEGILNVEATEEMTRNYVENSLLYVWDSKNEEIIENPDYIEQKAAERKNLFLQDFFEVEGYGYYRRIPKGYQSAVESMNVLFNIANVNKGVQAGLIIFYSEPDFTDPEQCTEKWLVAHQIVEPSMSLEEFMQLYVAFMTAWNTQEHIDL